MESRKVNRRDFIKAGLVALAGTRRLRAARAFAGPGLDPAGGAAGRFDPTRESLARHRTPEWFRDAKFGISAQWIPQSVPEQGDWYARNMYIQGSAQYEYHVAHYGHPSWFGYKDLCHRWCGAAWDPDGLAELYRKAGARYLVAMANHHDGFDCWRSRYQPWNSVNIGPRRDIIGSWARSARRQGLRFGVAVFAAQNWEWFNVSHGCDRTGPLKGVPYDGNMTEADGAGLWWQGYDPRRLYDPPHPDREPPPPAYHRNFFERTKDVIDSYHPDLVFFTDRGLPLGETGLRLAAHFYNVNRRWHGGVEEAVINTKHVAPDLRSGLVWDRLPPEEIAPNPWQMDICIGDWLYRRNQVYRSAADVIPYLVDVISKNGNLLLNLPIRADGSLDEQELAILQQIADWMSVNGEAIYDTRPWRVFGEGPTRLPMVDFPYVKVRYTARDIRFTVKGTTLYATALGWPSDGRLVIRSLGRRSKTPADEISGVQFLASDLPLKWRRGEEGLEIFVPRRPVGTFAYAFRIRFKDPSFGGARLS